MKTMKNEPAWLAMAARLLVAVAARYGMDLTVDQVLGVLVGIDLVVTKLLRDRVTPEAKTKGV